MRWIVIGRTTPSHRLDADEMRTRINADRSEIEVVAEADSPDKLLSALRFTPCDLLITDFSVPGGEAADGLGSLQRIRRGGPLRPCDPAGE
ncbi:hypothetical protein AB4Z46_34725 [Variovorax sp. M-6]|uniref:hypothetical protein n=1 Tax=Variovorax sp. M-6 TaxID=3233041 RepID=UPI003F9E02CC